MQLAGSRTASRARQGSRAHGPDRVRREIERSIPNTRMPRRHLSGISDVRFAHLDESPATWQESQRCVDEFPVRQLSTTSIPVPSVAGGELLLELDRARVPDVLVVDSHAAQSFPFSRAGRRIHLQTPVSSQLHRSHANSAGGSVYQHPLTCAHAGEVRQREVCGEKSRRYRRCLSVGPARGDARHRPVICDDNRSRTVQETHHAVAPGELEHIIGDLEDDAGAFKAEVVGRVIQCDQNITEVHTGAAHSQSHLAGLQRKVGFGRRTQDDVPRVKCAVAECGESPSARLD